MSSSDVDEDAPRFTGPLRVAGVRLSYGSVVALSDADLIARPGEVHGLLGENGAGKSSLIKILSGVVHADSGTVELDGQPLRLGRPALAEAAGVGTVFQELSLAPTLTAGENLALGRGTKATIRWTKRRMRAHAQRLLDAQGAPPVRLDRPVQDLSLAERQVLEVVRALSGDHRILIFDEATSALPPDESQWVLERARAAADNGAVVLFVTHRMQEIRQLCEQVTVLRGGTTVATGRTSEFTDDELITHMLGRRLERLYPGRGAGPGAKVRLQLTDWTAAGVGPVSLDVRRGEIMGIAGLQGHGERELFLGVAGALHSTGTMELEGASYSPSSPRAGIAAGVVLVPEDRQSEGLLIGHSILMNTSLASLGRFANRWGWLDRRGERDSVAARAAELGLPTLRLDDAVEQLSGGNQQKVVLSKSLLAEPKVLLLFDCTRGVDVGTKAQIFELMVSLTEAGVSVLFYSSDFTELVNMCDRIAVLSEGRVTAMLDRARSDFSEDGILRAAVGAGRTIESGAA